MSGKQRNMEIKGDLRSWFNINNETTSKSDKGSVSEYQPRRNPDRTPPPGTSARPQNRPSANTLKVPTSTPRAKESAQQTEDSGVKNVAEYNNKNAINHNSRDSGNNDKNNNNNNGISSITTVIPTPVNKENSEKTIESATVENATDSSSILINYGDDDIYVIETDTGDISHIRKRKKYSWYKTFYIIVVAHNTEMDGTIGVQKNKNSGLTEFCYVFKACQNTVTLVCSVYSSDLSPRFIEENYVISLCDAVTRAKGHIENLKSSSSLLSIFVTEPVIFFSTPLDVRIVSHEEEASPVDISISVVTLGIEEGLCRICE